MRNRLKRRLTDGASAVEYSLLLSLIAAVIVASLTLFGGGVSNLFTTTCQSIGDTCN